MGSVTSFLILAHVLSPFMRVLGAMFRRIVTLIFAAVPACLLLPFVLLIIGNVIENSTSEGFIYSIIGLIVGVMAILGVAGLFLVSFVF